MVAAIKAAKTATNSYQSGNSHGLFAQHSHCKQGR